MPKDYMCFCLYGALSYAALVKVCLQVKLHVFTEINLFDDSYDENVALAKANDKVRFCH